MAEVHYVTGENGCIGTVYFCATRRLWVAQGLATMFKLLRTKAAAIEAVKQNAPAPEAHDER